MFNQIAVEAGEELLTSVSAFEHPHCLVQDLTISKWDILLGLKFITKSIKWQREETIMKKIKE